MVRTLARLQKTSSPTRIPATFATLVEIGYTQNTINGNGYPEPKDVVVCKVWAACTDAGNQHYAPPT